MPHVSAILADLRCSGDAFSYENGGGRTQKLEREGTQLTG